ncbi:MAG: hypothetical protein RJB38_2047 [Pseudomonadota bacterium]|jgi:membrane-associated phospholipid phosphatase
MKTVLKSLFNTLERSTRRFPSLSSHALRRLLGISFALLLLGIFFRLGFALDSHGALPQVWQEWDNHILQWTGSHVRSPQYDFLILDLSSLGGLAVVSTLSLIGAVLLILTRDPAAAIHLALVAFGGFKIAGWAKSWFDRPRPDLIPKLIQVGGKSFPSGHAVTASAIYLTLALLASRHFRSIGARAVLYGLACTLIMIVSYTRIYLGVHYPSDVLSGATLGAAWALGMGALFSRSRKA